MTLPAPPLLVVTDRSQARRPLADVLEAAFAAGCRWASLREKDWSEAEQISLARSLLPLARQYGARLTLHGDPAIARAAGVDGVHLPAGGDVAAARATLGTSALIGLSVHGAAEMDALAIDRPDYVIAGPGYATASKPGYGPALGIGGLAAIVRRSPAPVVAIGGITASNLRDVIAAGSFGVAVMGGVMRAGDPSREIQQLLAALAEVRAQPRPR